MGFLNSLQLIAVFNFLFVGTVILLSRKKVSYGVSLLGVFLLAKGVTLFTNLTYTTGWTIDARLVLLLSSVLFLYAPFLYFFARFLVKNTKVALQKDYVHFIPFVAYVIYNAVQAIYPFETAVTAYSVALLYYVQTVSYTVVSFRLIHNKGNQTKQQHWIKYLLLAFIVVWAMFLSETVLGLFGQYKASEVFKILGIVSLLLLANITIAMAIYSPEFFFKGFRIIKPQTTDNKLITETHFEQLLSVMSNKALFTKPNLKVSDLSKELGMTERNTSLLIKTFHGGNFLDFVNSLRIEEAKRLFIEEQDSMSISEVLYQVGFNSKSVFNTAFKKKTGMTPSQFKKQHSGISSAI